MVDGPTIVVLVVVTDLAEMAMEEEKEEALQTTDLRVNEQGR